MASFFNATASLTHSTPLPPGSNHPSSLIALLHTHVFFIQSNPHTIHHERISSPPTAPVAPSAGDVRGLLDQEPACYSVTDKVHALPAGLWDSDVVSTYEFFNTASGVFVRIRSPLNVVMETEWTVRRRNKKNNNNNENEGGGEESDEWELVEEVKIKCSRLLMGVVKSTCESGWKGIHNYMMDRLKEESAKA